MSPYLTFVIIYFLTGIVRVIYDIKLFKLNIFSLVIVTLLWPIWPLKTFLFKKMDFKIRFTLYFVPLFYGVWLYAAMISGFSKIYSIENLYLRIFRVGLMLIIFCGVVWWFTRRGDKIMEKISKTNTKH